MGWQSAISKKVKVFFPGDSLVYRMKETYYSPENIERQAKEILDSLQISQRKLSLPLDPDRSALLVLDMQRYFLEETSHAFIPSASAILPKVRGLIHAYHARDLPVVFTRHVNTPEDAAQMAVWWREVITDDNPLSQVTSELDVRQGRVLNKSQYDAFYNTELEGYLRAEGVTQVLICGVMTHLCCETTARSAFMRGFQVFFSVDGTATYNLDYHRAALMNLAHGFAVPVLVDDMIARVEAGYE